MSASGMGSKVSARARLMKRLDRAFFKHVMESTNFPHTDRFARLQRLFGRRPSFPWEPRPFFRAPWIGAFIAPGIFIGATLYWSWSFMIGPEMYHSESNRTIGAVERVAAHANPRFQYVVPANPAEEDEEVSPIAAEYHGEKPLMVEVTRAHPAGRELTYEELVLAYLKYNHILELGNKGPLGSHKPGAIRLAHFAALPSEFAFYNADTFAFFSEIGQKPPKPHEVDDLLPEAESSILVRFPDSWSQEERDSFTTMLGHHSELVQARLGLSSRVLNSRKARAILQSLPLAAVVGLPEAQNPRRLYLQELLVRQTQALYEAEQKGVTEVETPQLTYLEFCKEFGHTSEIQRLSKMEHPETKQGHEILTVEQIGDVLSSVSRDILRQPAEKKQSSVQSLSDLFETVASRISESTPVLGGMEDDVASMA